MTGTGTGTGPGPGPGNGTGPGPGIGPGTGPGPSPETFSALLVPAPYHRVKHSVFGLCWALLHIRECTHLLVVMGVDTRPTLTRGTPH